MYETYGGVYVSLHVRVSNKAALALYRDTLGFKVIGTESKYYADGEDAYSMRMDLDYLKDEQEDESDDAQDEGEAVGSEGGTKKKDDKNVKRKVKVGRQMGVADLVEKIEPSTKKEPPVETNGMAA